MNSDYVENLLGLALRHGLTTFGGMLVSGGYLDSSDVSAFAGAVMIIAGVAWSWWQKTGQMETANLLKGVMGTNNITDAKDAAKGIIKADPPLPPNPRAT